MTGATGAGRINPRPKTLGSENVTPRPYREFWGPFGVGDDACPFPAGPSEAAGPTTPAPTSEARTRNPAPAFKACRPSTSSRALCPPRPGTRPREPPQQPPLREGTTPKTRHQHPTTATSASRRHQAGDPAPAAGRARSHACQAVSFAPPKQAQVLQVHPPNTGNLPQATRHGEPRQSCTHQAGNPAPAAGRARSPTSQAVSFAPPKKAQRRHNKQSGARLWISPWGGISTKTGATFFVGGEPECRLALEVGGRTLVGVAHVLRRLCECGLHPAEDVADGVGGVAPLLASLQV